MPVFRGSRFRRSKPNQVTDQSGSVSVFHAMAETTTDLPVGTTRHVVGPADTFETLAESEYGNGNKWYVIARANPEIFWPLDLEAGMTIWIPPKAYAESQ